MPADSLIEIAKLTSPKSIREYAKSNGWVLVPDKVKGRFYLLRNIADPLRQVVIPMDGEDPQYAEMVLDVAQKIASNEKRRVEAVLNDLLLPNADILRFRLTEPKTTAGSIPLEDGINLLEGARKALLAAACSVVSPQSHHPRMSRTEAEQLLGNCKLGQTERGSYVVKIACPLDAVEPLEPPETSLFGQQDEPFVRRTTKLLLKSARRITDAIERDQVERIYQTTGDEPVISSNLCGALLQMQAIKDSTTLAISARWASTRPETVPTPEEVQFKPEYFTTLSEIYDKLRPPGEDQESIFVATVETLNGDIGADGKRAGDVSLWVFHDDETISAHVRLGTEDYEIADKAHMTGAFVVFKGVLHRGRRTHKITNVEGFALLPDIETPELEDRSS